MRQDRLALVDIAADDEAFLRFCQPVEFKFEAEFATPRLVPWKRSIVCGATDVVVRVESPVRART